MRLDELLRDCSLEATLPRPAELQALRGVAPAGSGIYLAAPPTQPPQRLAELAQAVRAAGFEPVPHLAARRYGDTPTLDDVLARLAGEAGVTRVLVVGGDQDPCGRFGSALQLIESDLLQRNGIAEVGIAAYPDGHPRIGDDVLAQVLPAKLQAAAARGLRVHIVTQFCFDPERILGWLRVARRSGISAPVRVGMAGPTSLRALLRFALRCGVRASLKGMLNPGALQLLREATPDDLVGALAAAEDASDLAPLAVHLFSFGGLVRTAEWLNAATRSADSARGVARP